MVYKGRNVAMKRFSELSFSYDEQEIRREAALMSILEHPNLVTFIGACLQPGMMFVLTELYPANLQSVVEDLSIELPLPLQLRIALGVANGMKFLHSLGLIHRDLKWFVLWRRDTHEHPASKAVTMSMKQWERAADI